MALPNDVKASGGAPLDQVSCITDAEDRTLGPLGFLTGVVLGTAAAISLVLLMVLAVFALSGVPGSALGGESRALLVTVSLFALLALAAAGAFYGLQNQQRWRWLAQGLMWLILAGIAWYYWPNPPA